MVEAASLPPKAQPLPPSIACTVDSRVEPMIRHHHNSAFLLFSAMRFHAMSHALTGWGWVGRWVVRTVGLGRAFLYLSIYLSIEGAQHRGSVWRACRAARDAPLSIYLTNYRSHFRSIATDL